MNNGKLGNQTYTSTVVESHIDALIKARPTKTVKMQWTMCWGTSGLANSSDDGKQLVGGL